jgi:hypothetical protein
MAFGPLQILTIGFGDTSGFEGRIATELIKLSDTGIIRIVDALAVVADGDEVEILRVSDLDEEQRTELGMEIGALIGLGMDGLEGMLAGAEVGAEAVEEGELQVVEAIGAEFIDALPDGAAALVLIIEHKWAVPLREAIVDAGGMLIGNQWIGAQDLVELGMALGAAADAVASLDEGSRE